MDSDAGAKFMREIFQELFRALVKFMGLHLIVRLASHKNTNAKVEPNCVICDTLHIYARGHNSDLVIGWAVRHLSFGEDSREL